MKAVVVALGESMKFCQRVQKEYLTADKPFSMELNNDAARVADTLHEALKELEGARIATRS